MSHTDIEQTVSRLNQLRKHKRELELWRATLSIGGSLVVQTERTLIITYGREQTPVPEAVYDEFRTFVWSRISELDADISGIEQALSNLGDGGELR